jgi:hypothetical protein
VRPFCGYNCDRPAAALTSREVCMDMQQDLESHNSGMERLLARRRRDQELMVSIAEGDSNALEEIWNHYRRWLSYYLWQKGVEDVVQADELLQQIRHNLACFAHKYDPQTLSTVGSWLGQIANNVVCQDYLKDPQVRRLRDQELMARVATGDGEALNLIWGLYEDPLSAHVRHKPGVEENQVGDILQAVRHKIVEDAQRYDPEASTVGTWFTMIANYVIHQRTARGTSPATAN